MNKEIKKTLPKTWEEWVENNNQVINEIYIDAISKIRKTEAKFEF